ETPTIAKLVDNLAAVIERIDLILVGATDARGMRDLQSVEGPVHDQLPQRPVAVVGVGGRDCRPAAERVPVRDLEPVLVAGDARFVRSRDLGSAAPDVELLQLEP